jgi:capsule biosynthesis phosphatase
VRLQNATGFPKPLCHVLGIPLIQHVLKSIPSEEITFILNKNFKHYNFDTAIHHLTPKKIECIYLDRQTRGALETAYLGVKKLGFDPDEPVCFFDNDTIYQSEGIVIPDGNFIGYSVLEDTTRYHPYCFITTENGNLTDIVEKKQVSNVYACGVYGFKTVKFFLEAAREVIGSPSENELYMSVLYSKLLVKGETIQCVNFPKGVCLGTPEDMAQNESSVPFHKLRVCFDIDNTIMKYRTHEQTYGECEPNESMVFLIKKLKELGHTIILHTARGMKTAKGNEGLAMKNVALDTFTSLEKNDIPFDEIYFGKPDADIYIDDKAFNPYINTLQSIGFGHLEYSKPSHNTTNKFNEIRRVKDTVVKTGPPDSMKGEIYFYKVIKNTKLSEFFPRYITSGSDNLQLEFVEGFTLFDLLEDELLTTEHLDILMKNLDIIHSCDEINITISKDKVYENYMGKLKKRILNKKDYPFENTDHIIQVIDPLVKDYIYRPSTELVPVVHGDPWFSNTFLTKNNKIIFLDMKGDIAGELTTNGDAFTDFGKILQSLMGFDFIVNNTEYNKVYLDSLKTHYINRLIQRGFNARDIYSVSACLVAKTLSFLEDDSPWRSEIWKIIECLTELAEHHS